jgi:hypothetical protein
MSDSRPESKTFVQVVTDIPIIGEYLTTLLALGPPFVPTAMLFGSSEDTPGAMLLFAILSLPWIYWLQKRSKMLIVLPLIRLPVIYLTPVWFVIGIAKFF